MAIRRSNAVTLSSAKERQAKAAEYANVADYNGNVVMPLAASATSGEKTPDYHLPWTGAVVEETLRKMMDFDPASAGGVIVLESTAGEPAEIDGLIEPGNYTARYAKSTLRPFPEELTGVSPINIIVYEKDNVNYQMIEGMGDRYTRYSTDEGTSWSVWSDKATNTGGINRGDDPETPAEDPFKEVTDKVTDLEQTVAKSVTLGTTEEATAMLEGKYDWDTGSITE